jgi:hypothetical protein
LKTKGLSVILHDLYSIAFSFKRGKSGQCRIDIPFKEWGIFDLVDVQIVSQKITAFIKVRVKMCGKSARYLKVTSSRDKPYVLKCHVYPLIYDCIDPYSFCGRWKGRQIDLESNL